MRRPLTAGVKAVGIGVLACALTGAVAWAAETMRVIEREGFIRKSKFNFSPKVATVTEGSEVTVLAQEDPWIRVAYNGVEGWMSLSAVVPPGDFIPSSDKVAMETRASEQSAARRGFTPEVEAEYRKGKPNLDDEFKFLDQLQSTRVPEDRIVEFLRAGKLAGFGEGGGQ